MERPRVLWVSKHEPLPAQWEYLRRKIGDFDLVKVVGHIPNAEAVIDFAKKYKCNYVLPVLPLSFIARLCELAPREGITVLWSEMESIFAGSWEEAERVRAEAPDRRAVTCYPSGICKVHEFRKIVKVKEVKLVTEEL